MAFSSSHVNLHMIDKYTSFNRCYLLTVYDIIQVTLQWPSTSRSSSASIVTKASNDYIQKQRDKVAMNYNKNI